MDNICRAFTFFHDKLVINLSDKMIEPIIKKQFVSIGYFDWFSTESWSLKDYSKKSFIELFEYNSKLNRENCEFQSFQNVFGFNEKNKDSWFWSDDGNKILHFVMFLQFDKYSINSYEKINENLSEQNNPNVNYIIYRTLDKNDFIVCFKSRVYKEVIKTINHLYSDLSKNELSIIYSYTNLIIKLDTLKDDKTTESLDELIDSICIKTILNNYNIDPININEKIDYFLKQLAKSLYNDNCANDKMHYKEIVGYEILGDTDCRFIARDVPIKNLLRLFFNNGILTRDNPIYRYCFVSSMTSLNVIINQTNTLNLNNIDKKSRNISFSDLDQNKSIICELSDNLTKDIIPIITLLNQINNYILFADYQTSKYEVNSLINPFQTLLTIIRNNYNNINDGSLDIDELYSFLTNMYSSIQENIRTDIRFYGISDFSMMSYYSPTKLRSFYYFVINKISKYYADMSSIDKDKRYDFFIFFTHTQTTNVNQLWRNVLGKDKLMMVKISEIDFYIVKDLLFQLAHEAAHYVGNEEVRKRKTRFELIFKYLFYRIYNVLFGDLSKLSDQTNFYLKKEIDILPFDQFYSISIGTIEERVNIITKELIENQIIENSSDLLYLKNLESNLDLLLYRDDFIVKFFNEYMLCLLEGIKASIINSDGISIDEMRKVLDEVKGLKNHFNDIIKEYKWTFILSYDCDYEYIKNLMYESYADLCAVFLFDLQIDEYFDIILSRLNNDLEKVEDYSQNLLFQRGCIVAKAIATVSKKYPQKINNSFKNFFSKMPLSWENKCLEYDEIIDTCKSIEKNLLHPAVYTYHYICECLEAHCKYSNESLQDELKTIYKKVCENNAIDVVKYINEFVSKEG